MTRRKPGAAVAVLLATALAVGACSGDGGGGQAAPAGCIRIVDADTGKTTSECLPVAPEKDRVDLARPVFSNPTAITNPLHPSSRVPQVVYGGQVDGKPFRTEFTLLPGAKTITVDGVPVAVRTVQYMAVSDGRIKEVAYDWFAQADDGSVWYLGEDVFMYENGVVAGTEGTWVVGKDGPPAMIMPAAPKVGNVYRPENAPEVVFEEVTVKAVDQTIPGPYGPIRGAMTVSELHMDGTREDKVFAPGYGEFSTGNPSADLEAAILAVPTDATPGPVPNSLTALSAAVRQAHTDPANPAAARNARTAWDAYVASDRVPDLAARQMTRDLDALASAAQSRDTQRARSAALRVAQNELDLHLRYEPLAVVEAARMDLWARQVHLDAAANDPGAVAGDVTCLELTWERVRPALAPAKAAEADTHLRELRSAADRKDTAAAAQAATRLQATLAASPTK